MTSATPKLTTSVCLNCNGVGHVLVSTEGQGTTRPCECLIRENNHRRLKFAEVPEELQGHMINSFDLSLYSPEGKELAAKAKRVAANYVKDFKDYQAMGKGLYFYSDMPGSGKTRLAVSVGNALWELYGLSVGFKTVIGLMDEIKATWSKEGDDCKRMTQEKLVASVCEADVFIFDDIGTERPTLWVEEMMFHVIDARKTRLKPTIFTSNCEAEHLSYCKKLIQRISNMAVPVQFPNESVRSILTMSENERLQLKLLRR